MGCGGSRADAIEPRYYESWTRETESTWLTNTDSESPPQGDGAEPAPRPGILEDGKSTQTGVTTASTTTGILNTEKKASGGSQSASAAAPAAPAAAPRPSSFRTAEVGPQRRSGMLRTSFEQVKSKRDTKKMPTKEVTINVAKSIRQSDRRLAKNCVN